MQRVGIRERLKRGQGDFGAGGANPRPANLHLPSTEDDLAGDRPGAGRCALVFVRIPWPADCRPIGFEHRRQDSQTGRDGELHQLGPRIDEEIDEGQMALERGINWCDRSTVRDSRFMAAPAGGLFALA
jgi:hypothetical protein